MMLAPILLLLAQAKPTSSEPPAPAAPDGGIAKVRDLRPVFGRDNAAFARGLFRNGFDQLASDFCAAFVEWNEARPEEKAAVRSVYLDMRLEEARQDSDPVKRKDALSQILKEKEAFIAEYAGSTEAKEAEAAMPDAYRMLGEALVTAIEKVTDPEQAKALREEGSNAFAHVQEVLRKQKRAAEDALSDATLTDEQTDALRDQRATAWFNLARTEYFRAQLYGKEDPERARRLKLTMQTLQEFALEFDDKVLAYNGYVFQGLCEKELGDGDAALASFDQAIGLREAFDLGDDGKYKVSEGIDDVVSWAVLQKVNALTALGRDDEALEAVGDFYSHSPAPERAQFGLALLAARAEAEMRAGATKSAEASAQRLLDLDPNGPWGARGRELLAKSGGATGGGAKKLGSSQLLKIADSAVSKGEYAKALEFGVRALDAARGDSDASVDALIMLGAIHGKQKDWSAAAICFDTAWLLHPKAARTSDALFRAMNCYMQINATEKRPFFAQEIERRKLALANDYPSSPHAAKIQLLQGKALEDDQKFSDAADFYFKVQPGTPNYEEAQYQGSRCLVKEAQRVVKAKQADQVKPIAARADEQLRKCIGVLEQAAEKMLDPAQKQVWESQAFECRTLLANLYMLEGVGRSADVSKVFEGLEERYADDSDKVAVLWSLRIQALNSLGKFDDAGKLLEALLQKSSKSRGTAAAAGVFARSCDARAVDLLGKDPASKEGAEAWKKAFRYYVISLKPKLKDAAAARSGELEQVAVRFFIMGKHFNGVPDRAVSFLSSPVSKLAAPEYFEESATLYASSLELVPSYRTRINLARALGFLGRYDEASEQYGKLFDQEHLVDVATGEVDKALASQRPELLAAYLEWGVCELKTGMGGANRDVNRLTRANAIFDVVVKHTRTTARERSENWWTSRYWQLRAWVDQGEYKNADFALRDIERNTSDDFDQGKYGLRDLFKKMKGELAGKVFK
jgi:hypothetical protein